MLTTEFYDESYKKANYFSYREWLYAPYVSSLIAFCGLNNGDSILDVGCGQGFFSYQFNKNGLRVHGIDLSETGIHTAKSLYGRFGITFSVSNAQTATFPAQFDCVFVRSCSLYNTDCFPSKTDITDSLMKHLRVGGMFVFVYNSKFSARTSSTWRHHSFADLERHFTKYSNAKLFFLNKYTTYLFRNCSFSRVTTRFNILLGKLLGMGGDLVCVVEKLQSFEFGD